MTTPIIEMTEEQKESVKNDFMKFELPKKLTGLEGFEDAIKHLFTTGGTVKTIIAILKKNNVKATTRTVNTVLTELGLIDIEADKKKADIDLEADKKKADAEKAERKAKREKAAAAKAERVRLNAEAIARGEEPPHKSGPGRKPSKKSE